MRKTKIVATLGPATDTKEAISALAQAGVDAFRLNCSHGVLDEHEEKIRLVREVCGELGLHSAVLQDLPGPKIRVGKLPSPLTIRTGDEVELAPGEAAGNGVIPVQYQQIAQDLEPGAVILIDDGNIELKAKEIKDGRILCTVVEGGKVSSAKGINLPGAKISATALEEHDIRLLKWGVEKKVDYIALSFVRTPEEVRLAKEIVKEAGGSTKIIAKIEKPEALKRIDEIVDEADGIMVARGDLGVEMKPETVPEVQKTLIRLCNEKDKPVITATQMLESMTHNMRPTRAEASDVANAILDGTDCVMLSGETAVGEFPVRAVQMMDRIARSTEAFALKHLQEGPHTLLSTSSPIDDAVCHGVYQVVNDIDAKLIGIFTISGNTALLMSKYRPPTLIAGLSYNEESLRRMSLYYGVRPVSIQKKTYFEEMVAQAETAVRKMGLAAGDDTVIFTAGLPIGTSGNTNSLQIRRLGK